MKTVTLEVREPSEAMADFVGSWKSGKAQRDARIAFATPELLWKVLTGKRWELLKALCGVTTTFGMLSSTWLATRSRMSRLFS